MRVCLLTNTDGRRVDGVADHAHLLARELNAAGASASLIERCHAKWLLHVEGKARVELTAREARRHATRADWVIIEYSPFGMARWGFAPWLLSWAARVTQRTRLATFMHEPYLDRGRGHACAIAGWQRIQLRTLLHLSSCAVSPIERWAQLIATLAPSLPVAHIPVGSNLPDRRGARALCRDHLGARDRIVVSLFSTGHDSRLDLHARAALESVASVRRDILCLNLGAGAGPIHGLSTEVEIRSPGWLDAGDLAAHVAATDIFLSPLVDGASTRRTTIAAALQHGVPIVATDGPLTDSTLRAPASGLALAPVDDPGSFAALAKLLARDPRTRAVLAREARSAYKRVWDWPVGVSHLLVLLRKNETRKRRHETGQDRSVAAPG